jgi:putative methyltransferase (TIGR04325 family)
VKTLLPKPLLAAIQRRRSAASGSPSVPAPVVAEWEHLPGGWPARNSVIKGWNEPTIAETQRDKWNSFLDSLKGTGPLGISHEAPAGSGRDNRWAHNVIMSYAYALTLASRNLVKMSLLDWGGGVGHYYPISRALLPDVELEYHCKDLHVLAEVGKDLQPGVDFTESDDDCFARQYDFVVAGSSLWCVEHWQAVLDRLAGSTKEYLYVTRMMFTNDAPSFVALQRPYAYGYETEYPLWILNEREFIAAAERSGMKPVREFLFGEGPPILNAPARGIFKGFLFRRA